VPGLFRKAVKPSKSMVAFALVIAVGLNLEFIHTVWLDAFVNDHRVNFATLPLYWLLWNLFPLTIFGIGRLLRKQGK
jgi:hypothetical protein